MTEEIIGRNDRLKFYVACFWTNELDFWYYARKQNANEPGLGRRRRKIMARSRQMEAF